MSERLIAPHIPQHPAGATGDYFQGISNPEDPDAPLVPGFYYWHGHPRQIDDPLYFGHMFRPGQDTYMTGMVLPNGEIVCASGAQQHTAPIAQARDEEPVATFQAVWMRDDTATPEINVVVLERDVTAADEFIAMLQRNIAIDGIQLRKIVVGPQHKLISGGPAVPLHQYGATQNAA